MRSTFAKAQLLRVAVLTLALPLGSSMARAQSPGTITTIAGTGVTAGGRGASGFSGDGGPADKAALFSPEAVGIGAKGVIYVADTGNQRVRRITRDGIITTVGAVLGSPIAIATDRTGNLYVTDPSNGHVLRLQADGTSVVIAGTGAIGFSGDGGPATKATLNFPGGVTLDSAGNIFIADTDNHLVRRVGTDGTTLMVAGESPRPQGGVGQCIDCPVMGAFSGDGGAATLAHLNRPTGLAFDMQGNLYIADTGNNRIRRVDSHGVITTVAGVGDPLADLGDGGMATKAKLATPVAVAVDADNNLFIADDGDNRIRRVSPDGIITTVAGTGEVDSSGQGLLLGDGGPATSAALSCPTGVAVDASGNLLIADAGNNRIREVYAVAAAGLLDGQPLGNGTLTGDVNGDGKVTVADALLALRIALGTLMPTPAQTLMADANGDGTVDVADAMLILRWALGL